jgi:hypothetical protein
MMLRAVLPASVPGEAVYRTYSAVTHGEIHGLMNLMARGSPRTARSSCTGQSLARELGWSPAGPNHLRKAGAGLSDFAGSRGCLLTLRLCLPGSAAHSTTGTGMPGWPHHKGEGGGLDPAGRQVR